MQGVLKEVSYIAGAIIGLAILAVILSKNANTVGVINASGNQFTKSLGVALSPVVQGWAGGINSADSYGSGFGLNGN